LDDERERKRKAGIDKSDVDKAGIWWLGTDGMERIIATMNADGTVTYPTKDGK
jgi:hypothetical protein